MVGIPATSAMFSAVHIQNNKQNNFARPRVQRSIAANTYSRYGYFGDDET